MSYIVRTGNLGQHPRDAHVRERPPLLPRHRHRQRPRAWAEDGSYRDQGAIVTA